MRQFVEVYDPRCNGEKIRIILDAEVTYNASKERIEVKIPQQSYSMDALIAFNMIKITGKLTDCPWK